MNEDDMKLTSIEEIKSSSTYRYVAELMKRFHNSGVEGEPVEIAMRGIIDAPLPDYLPIPGAVRVKFLMLFIMYSSSGRWGAMTDATPGVMHMMKIAQEEI